MVGNTYLIRNIGKEFPNLDPDFSQSKIDKNPFGFRRKTYYWKWTKGRKGFYLSPEPPGLQVGFYNTSKKEEVEILEYIQKTIKEKTKIIWI